MDKKDLMYGIGAILIILIIALVIKPVLTGQPVNTGIPVATTIPVTVSDVTPITPIITPITPITPITTPPTPTPVPTWDSSVKSVDFIDPSVYNVSFNETLPAGTRFDSVMLNTSMTSYAKIDGQYSGTTQTIDIPFPYWELVYTVAPVPATKSAKVQITPSKGEGLSYSGYEGSYSTATPELTLQVMDAGDPNRIVRTISPPGGIDLDLWTGVKKSVTADYSNRPTNQQKSTTSDIKATDPRPWTEKFYEGQRSYFFIIKAQGLESYSLDIKVPSKYIGQY